MVVITPDIKGIFYDYALRKCNTSIVIKHYIYLTGLLSLWVLYK